MRAGGATVHSPGVVINRSYRVPPNHVTLSEGRYFYQQLIRSSRINWAFSFHTITKSSIYIGPPWRIVSWAIPSWAAPRASTGVLIGHNICLLSDFLRTPYQLNILKRTRSSMKWMMTLYYRDNSECNTWQWGGQPNSGGRSRKSVARSQKFGRRAGSLRGVLFPALNLATNTFAL
jgi:hypothetical protein